MEKREEKALRSLMGIALGDALGECIQRTIPLHTKTDRMIPVCEGTYTDDTVMAISIFENLKQFSQIDQDDLVQKFTDKFVENPSRMYGMTTANMLLKIHKGAHWKNISFQIMPGGSYGNGAAMRVALVGGYFYDDPEKVALEAEKSAVVTHCHLEACAGAKAVALAACFANPENSLSGNDLIKEVIKGIPISYVREGLVKSLELESEEVKTAAHILGTGGSISCQDTVPFSVWCAARNIGNFENAIWDAVQELGDRDTVCAIVGGIVALSVDKLPEKWLQTFEKLPENILNENG